jgi:hypothetical protein
LLVEAEREEFLGEDGSRLQGDVFQFGQRGTPGGAMGSEQIVRQFLGDAFEVGPQRFDLGVKNFGVSLASHPWPPGKWEEGTAVRERG